MFDLIRNACRRPGIVLLVLMLGAVAVGAAPIVVDNGDQPRDGRTTAKLTELWRAGGDDDEIFFGSVARVCLDPEGNVMILDGQLAEVHVIAADGERLRTVGGEGDGPGEVRRPNDMFVLPDGTVCVLQGFPGRIVMLHPDGTPAGESTYSSGEAGAGQFSVLVRGLPQPDGMLLAGISMGFTGPGQSNQDFFLDLTDPAGVRRHALVAKTYFIDYNDFVLDEQGMDFVWNRVALGPGGRVFTAPERNVYQIQIYDTAGTHLQTINRTHTSPQRDAEQVKQARLVLEAVGANYPTPPQRITTEPTPPTVADMWVTRDGQLWVQTGDEQPGRPDGAWAALDVFDPAGTFVRQVALPGDHDQSRDALYLLPDQRLVVVTGALDAFLSQQAVSDDDAVDADPLEIICYDLTY